MHSSEKIDPDEIEKFRMHKGGSNEPVVVNCSFEQFKPIVQSVFAAGKGRGTINSTITGIPEEFKSIKVKDKDGKWQYIADWIFAWNRMNDIAPNDEGSINGAIEKLSAGANVSPLQKQDRIWPGASGFWKNCFVKGEVCGEELFMKWTSRSAVKGDPFIKLIQRLENFHTTPPGNQVVLMMKQMQASHHDSEDDTDSSDCESICGQYGVDKEQFYKDVFSSMSLEGCSLKTVYKDPINKTGAQLVMPSGFRLNEAMPEFMGQIAGMTAE